MAKVDGLEIRFEDDTLDALMMLTEALDKFADALTAAIAAVAVLSPVVVNNYHLQISEEDDPR